MLLFLAAVATPLALSVSAASATARHKARAGGAPRTEQGPAGRTVASTRSRPAIRAPQLSATVSTALPSPRVRPNRPPNPSTAARTTPNLRRVGSVSRARVAKPPPGRAEVRSADPRPAEPGQSPAAAVAAPAVAVEPAQETPEPSLPARPAPMARVGDVELLVPAAADVKAVLGFHQAGASNRAHALSPLGTTLDVAFAGFAALQNSDGHDHHVLASRGRGTGPTSAVDVALPEGSEVLAPVTGVVTTVSGYALYGRYRDTTVAIVSDADPGLTVHLFHVQDPAVKEGQRVEAGVTPVATVRRLPFESQIDQVTKDGRPHAHVEVRPS